MRTTVRRGVLIYALPLTAYPFTAYPFTAYPLPTHHATRGRTDVVGRPACAKISPLWLGGHPFQDQLADPLVGTRHRRLSQSDSGDRGHACRGGAHRLHLGSHGGAVRSRYRGAPDRRGVGSPVCARKDRG